jgi:multiple sugar transport system substrate-binding protein
MKNRMMNSAATIGLLFGAGLGGATLSTASAQAADLTLCWAAWDPANALVELSKDFEAQSGHK